MLLGFISLLLTVGQSVISRICISEKVAGTFHPCTHKTDHTRRLLPELFRSDHNQNLRRILAAGGTDKCAAQVTTMSNFKNYQGCCLTVHIKTIIVFFLSNSFKFLT